ncbi:MAG: hypothetical protein BWK80_63040 [Desulfobacteraceae bacterium IS3]|nr:MAG: hypothetical protein BWK80_63040 [Desulfobacteraceae bacterium IS3]
MATIHVEPFQQSGEILFLLRSAVDGEIAKMEIALKSAMKRLSPFEKKYRVSSEDFITRMTAEDLENGDDEYISWAGEYKLMLRLKEKLNKLREVSFNDSQLFCSDQIRC